MRLLFLLLSTIAITGCVTQPPEPVASSGPSAAESLAEPRRGGPGGPGGAPLPANYKNENIHIGSVSTAAADRHCAQEGHRRLICLADALKASVAPEIAAELQRPYTLDDARRWSNFPPMGYRDRVGPTLGAFDREQLGLVKALLMEAASMVDGEGYDEIEQILNADDYLMQETGETGFSSSNFHIAFLGTPGPSGTWELQFGGHHTAFANTYRDGELIGATPSFRGVEPFGAFEMNGRSNEPLGQEQAAFLALLDSLTDAQKVAARLEQTFTDVVVGPQKDDNFPAVREGVKGSALTAAQRELMLDAIARYVRDIDEGAADAILARYRAELGDTYVAFSGSPRLDSAQSYVRIDGPSVWIEYSLQPGRSIPGIHPHSVWRDRQNDYGGTDD